MTVLTHVRSSWIPNNTRTSAMQITGRRTVPSFDTLIGTVKNGKKRQSGSIRRSSPATVPSVWTPTTIPLSPFTNTEAHGALITISAFARSGGTESRSEEHTSELQSLRHLVCRLLLETK